MQVKLADFGGAYLEGDGSASIINNICGAMTHCAPELYLGYAYTTKCVEGFCGDNIFRSDIYSLGIVIWEIFTTYTA